MENAPEYSLRHFWQVSARWQGFYELVWHLNSGQGNGKGAKVAKKSKG